ncbi:MAG: anion permease [Oscillospiraceae bacterium]|nr:anion permease [Oscillospiraceae bacterium]
MTKTKSYTHYIVALIISVLILVVVQPYGYLTRTGVHVLAVLIPTLYLWVTNHTDWVSLLMCAGLIITGVLSPVMVWQLSFGNQIIILIISCLVLNAILKATGVIEKVARWFVTRKFVQGRPRAFIAMFIFANFFLGIFLEALALMIIFIMIAETFLKEMGYKKGDSFYTAIMLGILWVNSVSSVGTPFSNALPLIMMDAVYAAHGVYITWGQWISIGLPWGFIMYGLMMLVICVFWRKLDTSKFASYDVEAAKRNSPPLSTEGKISAIVTILVILTWLFPEYARPFAPEAAAWVRGLGFAVPPIIGVSILCILRVAGKPIAVYSELVKIVPLGVLGFVAAVIVFGSALNHADAGIINQLRSVLEPLTAQLSPTIIVGIALVGSLILTKFISNTVTMLLFVHITIPLLVGTGISLGGVTILIGLAASLGALVPSSTVSSPLMFGPEHITVGNTWRYNLLYLLLAYIPVIFVLYPLANNLVR